MPQELEADALPTPSVECSPLPQQGGKAWLRVQYWGYSWAALWEGSWKGPAGCPHSKGVVLQRQDSQGAHWRSSAFKNRGGRQLQGSEIWGILPKGLLSSLGYPGRMIGRSGSMHVNTLQPLPWEGCGANGVRDGPTLSLLWLPLWSLGFPCSILPV